ncbi:MAG: YHS domain-containing protein [Betaproteobacteria bacterium]|nr:YHS domain-containing protein [Betaproteobacteria bacterium]
MHAAHLRTLAASTALLLVSGGAFAGEFYEKNGVAIKGFDPVAYFTDHEAIEGSSEYTATYKGSTFRFASMAHRDLFEADPGKYAPQYDGFCAYGVARGVKAKIEGDAFTIVDGKLYLNFDARVQSKWSKDIPGYLDRADHNWPEVSKLTKVRE